MVPPCTVCKAPSNEPNSNLLASILTKSTYLSMLFILELGINAHSAGQYCTTGIRSYFLITNAIVCEGV